MDKLFEYFSNQDKHDLLKTFLVTAGTAIAVSVTLYFAKIWNDYQYFKRRGIPGPKPTLLLGHTVMLRKEKAGSFVIEKMTKKYGATFGIFEGHVPCLVTSDLEIIQEVFIKQFNNFTNRKKFPLVTSENSDYKNLISTNQPGRWKRMRLIMNPTFSSLKIREMGPLLIKCVDRLIDTFESKENEKEIGINIFLKRFTMDSIWNCAFGLDIDLQNDPDNLFLKNSCEHIQNTAEFGVFRLFSFIFEELNWLIYPIYRAYENLKVNIFGQKMNSSLWLERKIGQLIDLRLEKKIERKDYMQLLLNVMSDSISKENDQKHLDELSNVHLDKQLTRKEVEANLVLFMIAGYETTSTALSYASHILTMHPDVQNTLYDEINREFGDGPNSKTPDTDNVKELEYLDFFCKEVLRYHPIALINRRCLKRTTVKGIDIMPEVCVRVDHRTISFSKEIWGYDADLFNPLRHKEKRNPLVYLAFGLGPRNCVGMKFAIVEMKLALVKLVLNFEFRKSLNTPEKLAKIEGIVTGPKDFSIILKKRK